MSLKGTRVNRWAERCDSRMHGATVWLLRLSRAFCVAPVGLKLRQNAYADYAVRVSRLYTVISFIIISIVGILMLASMSIDIYHATYKMEISVQAILSIMLLVPNYLLYCGVFIVSAVGSPRRMERFINYSKEVEKIYKNIESMSKPEGLEKILTFKLTLGVISSFIASVLKIVLYVLEILILGKSLFLHILHTFMYVEIVISCFLSLQSIFVLTSISWTFKSLNKRIRGLHADILMKGKKTGYDTAIVNNIHSFCKIFVSLIDLSTKVNATEGHIILILFLNFFFRILLGVYFCIIPIIGGGTPKLPVASISSFLFHCLSVIIIIVMLVEPCHRTHEEMKTTKVLISKMLCCSETERNRVSEALVCVYKNIELIEHVYAPYGAVKISRSFYSSFFGSLATFFVFMLQLKLSE